MRPAGLKIAKSASQRQTLPTALGPIILHRTYRQCRACQTAGFAADDRFGTGRFLTARARRLACVLGLESSFDRAAHLLRETVGWSLGVETLRLLCHAEAKALADTRSQRLDTAADFAAATGDWELQIDAGKVNTMGGWRDVKLATFARRQRGVRATAETALERDLPAPEVRAVIAAIEPAEEFGRRCRTESRRLGRPDDGPLTVLGDGAEWIWKLVQRRFNGAEQVLDIFHALGHVADLGRAGFGLESESMRCWLDQARRCLLGDGWDGLCEFLMTWSGKVPNQVEMEQAFPALANYFVGHRDRLGYAVRLHRGQAIGSGLVEGTIKQRVNQRMKQSGARWRVEYVGRFVELCAIADGPEWGHYWSSAA